jgi:hypothetical protein
MKLCFLFFLNGFLLASLIYLRIESNYEEELFREMKGRVDAVLGEDHSPRRVVLEAMHLTNGLLRNRAWVFEGTDQECLKAGMLESSSVDLMTTWGACGSYSKILARLLSCYGYPLRIGQMKANGHFGGHIIVEVCIDGRWVVTDPLYDVVFRKPDSSLATFADLHKGWRAFSVQVPAGYDSNYRYEGIRYTNWNKIPVLMPVLHWASILFLGERRTEAVCLRMLLLRTYEVYFYAALLLCLVLNGYFYFRWRRRLIK